MAKPKPPSKQIDIVIYKSGERIVIGKAEVHADGRIEAQIAKDVRKELKDLCYGDMLDNLSLNPKSSKTLDLKYNTSQVLSLSEARELINPPKIQE